MKITVTMELPSSGQMIDIQIDRKQRIKTTLRVLSENRMEFVPYQRNEVVRIKQSGRRISTERTYEEAGIFNGTVILLEKI